MMNLQKHFVYVPTKEMFDTLHISTSINDEAADIKWNQIAFINDTQQIWTHGKFFGDATDNVKYINVNEYYTYDRYRRQNGGYKDVPKTFRTHGNFEVYRAELEDMGNVTFSNHPMYYSNFRFDVIDSGLDYETANQYALSRLQDYDEETNEYVWEFLGICMYSVDLESWYCRHGVANSEADMTMTTTHDYDINVLCNYIDASFAHRYRHIPLINIYQLFTSYPVFSTHGPFELTFEKNSSWIGSDSDVTSAMSIAHVYDGDDLTNGTDDEWRFDKFSYYYDNGAENIVFYSACKRLTAADDIKYEQGGKYFWKVVGLYFKEATWVYDNKFDNMIIDEDEFEEHPYGKAIKDRIDKAFSEKAAITEPYELLESISYEGTTYTEKEEMYDIWHNYGTQNVRFKPYLRISKNCAYTIGGVPVEPRFLDNYGTNRNMRVLIFVYPDSEDNSISKHVTTKNPRYETFQYNAMLGGIWPRAIVIYRQSKNNCDKYSYYKQHNSGNLHPSKQLIHYLGYNDVALNINKDNAERSKIRNEINKQIPDYATCQRGWINISDTALICSNARIPAYAPRFDGKINPRLRISQTPIATKALGVFEAAPYYLQEVVIPGKITGISRVSRSYDISVMFDTQMAANGMSYSQSWFDEFGNSKGALHDNNMGVMRIRMYKSVIDEIQTTFENSIGHNEGCIWVWGPNNEAYLRDVSDDDVREVVLSSTDSTTIANVNAENFSKVCAGWINVNNELCGGNWMKVPTHMFYGLDELRRRHGDTAYQQECNLLKGMGIPLTDTPEDECFKYCDIYYHREMIDDFDKEHLIKLYIPRLITSSLWADRKYNTETYGYVASMRPEYHDMHSVGYVIRNTGLLRKCYPFLYPTNNKYSYIFGFKADGITPSIGTAMLVNTVVKYVGNSDCKVRRHNQTVNPMISRITSQEGVFNPQFDNKISIDRIENNANNQSIFANYLSDFETLMYLADVIADNNYEVWAKLKTSAPCRGHKWRRFMTNRKNNVRAGLNIGNALVELHNGGAYGYKQTLFDGRGINLEVVQQYDIMGSSNPYMNIWHNGQWMNIDYKQALAYYMLLSIIHGSRTFTLVPPIVYDYDGVENDKTFADECITKTSNWCSYISSDVLSKITGETYEEDEIPDPRLLRNHHLGNIDLINTDGHKYIDFMIFPRIKRPHNRQRYSRQKGVWSSEGIMVRLNIKYSIRFVEAIQRYAEDNLSILSEGETIYVTPLEYLNYVSEGKALRIQYLGTCKHPKHVSKHLE